MFIRRGVIGGVTARIDVVIIPAVAWNTSAQNEGGVFADFRQKSVTIAMSLERSWKCQIDLAHPATHRCTYPENLVKIGPVHFGITGLQGRR